MKSLLGNKIPNLDSKHPQLHQSAVQAASKI